MDAPDVIIQDVEMAFDSPSDPVFIEKIMTNDLICGKIFRNCSARALLRLAKTCQQCYVSVDSYCTRAFNINRLLSRYFPDPITFRSIQAFTHTLISGSTALQFFDRSFYPESDLDIYGDIEFKEYLGDYLMSAGYQFVPNSFQNADFEVAVADENLAVTQYESMIGVAGVFTFKKKGSDGTDLQVQLIVSARSAMEIILHYHSTVVMNVIAFDKVYCLYPRATLKARKNLVCRTDGVGKQEEALNKYRERGWSTVYGNVLPDKVTVSTLFRPGIRYISDCMSWVILLNMDGVMPADALTPKSTPLTRDPVSATTWSLVGEYFPRMSFQLLDSKNLFYQYAFWAKLEYPKGWYQRDNPPGNHLLDPPDRRYFDEEFIQACDKYYGEVFKQDD